MFGVPGTQTIGIWEAFRRAGRPRLVGATSELAAAFMANGLARATGGAGVVLTIPGPGFTYALPGIAEAFLDSAPVVHLTAAPAGRADGGFALQAIRQSDVAAPITKATLAVREAAEIEAAVREAVARALAGEPGPVLLELPEEAVRGAARPGPAPSPAPAPETAPGDVEALVQRLESAARPLVLAGQGAAGAAAQVASLAEALHLPVLTTTSGRGVLAETHPLCLRFDSPGAPVGPLQELIDSSDLVLVLGAKLSHNGTHGARLVLPPERLVRVDASPDVLARGYPAGLAVAADVGDLLPRVLARLTARTTWPDGELEAWRARLAAAMRAPREPTLAGAEPAALVGALRRALPEEAVVTTDSGLHQYVLRRHLEVLRPRTLLVPADFQSMGFGIPAAIGAAAGTGAPALAVVGDGGFAISATELATAVAESLPVAVLVLVDRAFGLIRRQQLRRTGFESGVALPRVDVGGLAAAVGAQHHQVREEGLESAVARALDFSAVTVIEVEMDDGRNAAHDRRLGRLRSALAQLGLDDAAARLRERRR